MGATFSMSEFDQERGRRLLLFDNGRAAATTNCAFIADFGLFDAVFSR
jgi:hypothetical protein